MNARSEQPEKAGNDCSRLFYCSTGELYKFAAPRHCLLVARNHYIFSAMPQSKLAFLRYLLIDQMLRNRFKKYPSKQEILEECEERFGVKSISTIEKDMKAMRLEFDAPIEYDKQHGGYHYSDPGFKLFSVNLSEENLVALSFVETFLEDFKAMPIFEEFSDAVDKVLDGLEITRNFGQDARPVSNFIQIARSPYLKGSETLSELIKHIRNQKVIVLDYRKFTTSQAKSYTIHPYLLKEFRGLWYLLGYVENYKEVRTFGVDRVTGLFTTENTYKSAETVGFRAEDFFKHCYGITVFDSPPERIVLKFSPYQGNLLKATPVHPSQVILADSEDGFVIELTLIPNYELRDLILSYGKNVEVLQPKSLRQQIAAELRAALNHY